MISKCGKISSTAFRIPCSKSHMKTLADTDFFNSLRHCKTIPKNIKYVANVLSGRYPNTTGTQTPFDTSAEIIKICVQSFLKAILKVPSPLNDLALANTSNNFCDVKHTILHSLPVCLFIYVFLFF